MKEILFISDYSFNGHRIVLTKKRKKTIATATWK